MNTLKPTRSDGWAFLWIHSWTRADHPQYKSSRPQKHSAITLLEILVVFGIIAISIGLILPAVQRVREASLRIQSTSNIKQIALAAQNYARDRRDRLPPVDGRVQFVGPSVHQALAV